MNPQQTFPPSRLYLVAVFFSKLLLVLYFSKNTRFPVSQNYNPSNIDIVIAKDLKELKIEVNFLNKTQISDHIPIELIIKKPLKIIINDCKHIIINKKKRDKNN